MQSWSHKSLRNYNEKSAKYLNETNGKIVPQGKRIFEVGERKNNES